MPKVPKVLNVFKVKIILYSDIETLCNIETLRYYKVTISVLGLLGQQSEEWDSGSAEMHALWTKTHRDDQQRDWDAHDADTHELEAEICRDDQWQDWDAIDADTHKLEAETHRRWLAMIMGCWRCRYTQAVMGNMQGTFSGRNGEAINTYTHKLQVETCRDDQRRDWGAIDTDMHKLWVEIHRRWLATIMGCWQCRYAQAVTRNMQGTFSGRNGEAIDAYTHKLWVETCRDDQRWDWGAVDTDMHELWVEIHRDDQQQDWDAINADTHELEAEIHRGWLAMRMGHCWRRYAWTMSRKKADGRSKQSGERQVTVVGHGNPERSTHHLPKWLGETCWLFMEVVPSKFELRPDHSPSH